MEKQKSATMTPTIQSTDVSSTEDLLEKTSLLQKAIRYGDIEKAKEIVAYLAKQKSDVSIQEKTDRQALIEDDMSVKIFVEDKDICGSHMILKLKSSTKIGELKRMMQRKHGFPLEIQKWIVGKKIVKDEDSLHRLRVKSGGSMYLYLLSPQSIGLTIEEYARKYNQQISDDSSRTRSSTSTSLQTPSIEPSLQWPQNRPAPGPARSPVRPVVDETPPVQPQGAAAPTAAPAPAPDLLNHVEVGWECPMCTYRNEPTRPGCEICAADRPAAYQVPEGIEYQITEREQRRLQREREAERLADEMKIKQEEENARLRTQNFDNIIATMLHQDVIANDAEFECPVCFDTVAVGEGVTLRECLHQFCRLCLEGQILASEEAQIKCPHQDDQFSCPQFLLDCEIKGLIAPDAYEKYLQRSLVQAESAAANSFHCKTPDCTGWCVYDDDVNFFDCMVCGKKNCLTCKVIHEGQNCKEYQDNLKAKAQNDEDAKKTQEALQAMLTSGDAMECPQCKVVITKKLGCDWLRCTMCKLEICWRTKGRRWGPKGTGDTSGGCRCNVNNKKCHPECQNCH